MPGDSGTWNVLTENGRLYTNSFGLDMKIVNLTLEEADVCRRQKVVITTFMLATDPMLTEFVEKPTLAELRYNQRVLDLATQTSELVNLGTYVENQLKAKSQESKRFTFFM